MRPSITKQSLDERIARAFTVSVTSGDVAGLINEVEAAVIGVGEAASRARERALDPTLSSADVTEARREMEDAAFRRDRLKTAISKLETRLANLRRQEEEQRRRAAYEKATAERDALAAELKELYPVFADRIANLMARIEANDREIERINTHASPEGAARMRGAELVARGLGGFSSGVSDIPRITRDLRLPAFEFRTNDDYAWPRLR
jgi:hypothetical protein